MRYGRLMRHGWVATRNRRLQATVLAMLLSLFVSIAGASAAPQPGNPALTSLESNLGGGTYAVTASVFGVPSDGLVGNATSSGHILQANDNLVALPACTESSCPWVTVGTGVNGTYGPQTTCAESDGYCYVEITSDSTGLCTVAPVLDRGPLFVRDNWWAPQSDRKYNLPQGTPAAEAARDGADLGFGVGISDVGYDIKNVYRYAAGIDLAAGTWTAIGLPISAGISSVTVTMLWQAGLTSDEGCNGSGGGDGGATEGANATVDSSLNLRSAASTNSSVQTVMPAGARVAVTGGLQDGFYPVNYRNLSGYAFGQYLTLDDGGNDEDTLPGDGNVGTATVLSSLNLRSGPGTSFGIIRTMAAGASVELTGDEENGFLGVRHNGTPGWAYADFLETDDGGDTGPGDGDAGEATIISSLNLRSGPGTSYSVKRVMPAGATVELTGDEENGFLGLRYNGESGWGSAQFIDTSGGGGAVGNGEFATVTSSLNLRQGAGADFSVIVVMPSGAEVELTGESANGYLQVVYNGQTGWAAAIYLSTGSGNDAQSATVIDGSLNLREGPATTFGILVVMPNGAVVQLTGDEENGFREVIYNGTTGWASGQYLD